MKLVTDGEGDKLAVCVDTLVEDSAAVKEGKRETELEIVDNVEADADNEGITVLVEAGVCVEETDGEDVLDTERVLVLLLVCVGLVVPLTDVDAVNDGPEDFEDDAELPAVIDTAGVCVDETDAERVLDTERLLVLVTVAVRLDVPLPDVNAVEEGSDV